MLNTYFPSGPLDFGMYQADLCDQPPIQSLGAEPLMSFLVACTSHGELAAGGVKHILSDPLGGPGSLSQIFTGLCSICLSLC